MSLLAWVRGGGGGLEKGVSHTYIHCNHCEIPMNSKAEWHQPVVARVVVTRELEELEEQGNAGGRARRRGGV